MSDAPLPFFKYHPDPLASGSIKRSNATCVCCGRARGYEYKGYQRCSTAGRACICPWCIANGSAHQRLSVVFHSRDFCGEDHRSVPQEIKDEIEFRTPGFFAWQEPTWWTHCGDAAQYLGRAGTEELLAAGPDAIAQVKEISGGREEDWQDFFEGLDRDGNPTAYLFRCPHCGKLGGYADST